MEFNPVHFDWNFVFTIINLLIFYLLIRKFLWGKIMNTMDKRKEIIEKDLNDAKEAKEQAEQFKQQCENEINNASQEANKIINEAKDYAKVEYNKTIEQAKDDAKKLRDEAQKAALTECEKTVSRAKEDVANLAVEMAQKIVYSSVSDKTDSDLYDEFLNEGSDK